PRTPPEAAPRGSPPRLPKKRGAGSAREPLPAQSGRPQYPGYAVQSPPRAKTSSPSPGLYGSTPRGAVAASNGPHPSARPLSTPAVRPADDWSGGGGLR